MNNYYLGIDIGSVSSKAVVIDDKGIVALSVMPSGTNYASTSALIKDVAFKAAGIMENEITASAATGIGGRNAGCNSYHGVILCDAKGVHYLFPAVRSIIDIGGQGSQLISIDEDGRVINFNVSEICATGSARLLQVVARILGISIEDIGPLSMKSTRPSNFSTSCTVFLETEIITRISQGDKAEDILAGIHHSIADKISALSRGVDLQPDIAIIGGGALDSGLINTIEEKFGIKALVPDNPRIIAALGAALIARDSLD